MTETPLEILIFGPFRMDRSSYRVTRRAADGTERTVTLRPKAFDVLRHLVENAGRTIPLDEFLSKLWPQTYVQPEVLKGHILAIRDALKDRTAPARYIETVRGRGYRFVADVRAFKPAGLPGPVQDVARPLIGRQASRVLLDTAMARATQGGAQIVFLTGEAGIGKSTVAEGFSKAVASTGAVVVTGHCLPGSGPTDAYYPVLEMLTMLSSGVFGENLKTALAQLAPTWLVQLPSLMATGLSDLRTDVIDATPHRMARELCDVLGVLARTRPLLVVMEDVQWSDRATLDLIQAIASRKLPAKLMIVATLRSSVTSDDGRSASTLAQKLSLYRLASEIKLEPFTRGEVAAYLRSLSPCAPPEQLVEHLHVRSEGNPLFMQAMLDVLLQRELVSLDDRGWRLGDGFSPLALRTPPSLAQVIEAELDDLPQEAQWVLEAASVSDGPFSPFSNSVASELEEAAFEAVCEALCRRGQLIQRSDIVEMPGGRQVQTYRFRHALFREAVYDRQGVVRRGTAHLAVAHHIADIHADELSAVSTILAQHFLQAGACQQAIRFLRLSARVAMQRFAQREAAELLEQAMAVSRNLPAPERGETQLGVLEELARIYLGVVDRRAAETYERFSRLARSLGHVEAEARALFGLGYTLSWTDSDRCLVVMSEAIAKSAETADPVQRARLRCSAHGWRSWAQGWNAEDAQGLRTALDELRQLNDPIALHASLVDHSLILFPAARYVEAIDDVARGFGYLVAHGQEAGVDLSLPLWVTRLGTPWAQMSAGRLGDALSGFASGFAAFAANGTLGRGAMLRMYHAHVHERMQDYQAALDMLDETMALLRDSGGPSASNEIKVEFVVRGLAELGLGRIDDALAHFGAADAEIRTRNTLTSWYWRLALASGMTDALLMAGELAKAEVSASNFLDEACAIEERGWRAIAADSCARIALVSGNYDMARYFLARAWAEIEGYDTPLVRWRLHAVHEWLAEDLGEAAEADCYRRSRSVELAALADALPADHPARATLLAASPFMPSGWRVRRAEAGGRGKPKKNQIIT